MRITGHRMIDLAAASTSKSQEAVAARSAEMTSGLRVTKPSDDPAAYAAAERAKIRRTIAEGTGSAVKASRDRLEETDGALGSIGDIVSRVQELAVQGGNASYNANDRAALGAEVQSLFESALGSANTQSSSGEYLLGGSQSLTAPFDANGAYRGDALVRGIPATEASNAFATIAGSRLTSAYGVDVMPLLKRVATAMSTNDVPSLQIGIADLAAAVQQLGLARSVTGGAMNVLDATATARDQLSTHLSEEVSRNVEVDGIGAASALANASQALEASRAVSSHLVALLDPRSS
jgi:flagellar hook-associated protein 3 FlgL